MKVLLQEVRKAKGLSQNELAQLTRMSPQNIQKIEQGDAKSMTFMSLGRFCKILGCQPGDLLIYEDDVEDDLAFDDSVSQHQINPKFKDARTKAPVDNKRRKSRSRLCVMSDVPESA